MIKEQNNLQQSVQVNGIFDFFSIFRQKKTKKNLKINKKTSDYFSENSANDFSGEL